MLLPSPHTSFRALQGSVLPALIWLGFPELGWHLVVLMTLTLYVGNAMKDLVSAPRPLGLKYGKARLSYLGKGSEEAELNAKEYGLPSSHTMNSLCLNIYACHYLHEHDVIEEKVAGEGLVPRQYADEVRAFSATQPSVKNSSPDCGAIPCNGSWYQGMMKC